MNVSPPTFTFPGITNAKEAREAARQAARRFRPNLGGGMDATEIRSLMSAVAPVIDDFVKDATAPLVARAEAAEARLALVEQRDFASAIAAETAPIIARCAELEGDNAILRSSIAELEARKLPDIATELQPLSAKLEAMAECNVERDARLDAIGAIGEMITAAAKAEVAAIPLPQDGKDIDPAEVRRMVTEEVKAVVSALPAAEKGADGVGLAGGFVNKDGVLILTRSDGATVETSVVVGKDGRDGIDGKDGAHAAVEEVVEVIRPLLTEEAQKALDALPKPKDGQDGNDGKDADPAEVAKALQPFIVGEIGAEIMKLPAPADGKDGTSVTIDDVAPLIASEVAKAVEAIPPAESGRDGLDGKSVDPEEMRSMVAEEVGKIPLPKDGRDGHDVEDISVTQDGRNLELSFQVGEVRSVFEIELPQGPAGEDGKDGRSITKAGIDQDGDLSVTYSDGTVEKAGRVKGEPGKDGSDGLGFEDMEEELAEDGRTIIRRYRRGEDVREFQHKFSVPDYKGVHRDGAAYEKGDMVTFGGSSWIAVRDTSAKPESSSDWKLCAKRGRDGKSGKDTSGKAT